MNKFLKILIVSTIFLGIFSCSDKQVVQNKTKKTVTNDENYVVILSLDGFRHDYLDKYNAVHLKKIASNGVHVRRMNPSNPTKTFPNHYTIVTGLYPENHGIVSNSFYDKKLKKYSIRDRSAVQNGEFYGGEPIWNTAKKAGLKTASYFWVGSEAKINGMQPNYWKRYNHKTPFQERINTVISWLKLPEEKRPRFVSLYYNEPDSAGHHYGPDSEEVKQQVQYTDAQVWDLYKKLMELPIAKNINFIVVSDHGMRQLDPKKQIMLDQHLPKSDILAVYGGNPFFIVKAKRGKKEAIYQKLKKVPNLIVYKSDEVPSEYNLGNNDRFGDIVVIGEKGYSVFNNYVSKGLGTHGYLNTDEQMGSLFIATGNAFKKGYTQNSINNVDVYNLIANILEIKPAKNDGNFENVKPLLKTQN